MEKRDIRINYEMLNILLSKLNQYWNELYIIRDALEQVDKLVEANNDAVSFRQLKKRYKKAKKSVDKSIAEVSTLCNSLREFIDDMTGIIKPLTGTTRVGRNDIYMNMMAIKCQLVNVENIKKRYLPQTEPYEGLTDEDRIKMEKNYAKIYNQIQGEIIPKLIEKLEDDKETLNRYYKEKVKKYENKDDEHRWRALAARRICSSPMDCLRQSKVNHTEFVNSLLKGMKMAVIEAVEGIANIEVMLYYAVRADAARVVSLLTDEPPEWVEDALREYDWYFDPIVEAIMNPIDTIESMAQYTSDTYEKEGAVYIASYVITDFLLGKAMKGAGKADDVTDVANAAGKIDDVEDVAGIAGKADDVAGAAGKADDVADVAGVTSKADDVTSPGNVPKDTLDVPNVSGKGGKHSLSNVEARKWYLEQEAKIPDMIDKSLPLEEQAKQAFNLRNQFRTLARELMADRATAESLYKTDPNLTWEEIVRKQREKGLKGDDIYKAIIESSQRSRKSVNKSLGLE